MCTESKSSADTCAVVRRDDEKSRVTGLVTRRFGHLPTYPEAFEDFVHDAEWLSELVGVNPQTVTKKVPSENPDAVSEATLKKFFEAEDQCAESNLRLGLPFAKNGEFPDSSELFDESVLCNTSDLVLTERARELLDLTVDELNKLITLDWSLAEDTAFGPGVTQVPGFRTKNLVEKLTQGCYDWPNPDFIPNDYFVDDLAWFLWGRHNNAYTCDIISQVPKNSTINRTIGITSFISLAAQGVCGNFIRDCLRVHNVDLNTLANTHRNLAEVGSLHGGLATLDFSMASDTISRGLVWATLNNSRSSDRCRELYRKLVGCRTWEFCVEGVTYLYEKFSAMGNKFTFELESLLFTAIARGLTRLFHFHTPYGRKATSFGDDTIIYAPDPLLSQYKEIVVSLYAELGLKLNPEKSFFEGSFRESCGADYRDGVYVRGYYLHSRTVTLRDVVRCINHFTLYYGVNLCDILENCPFIAKVFNEAQLSQICYEDWLFINQLACLPTHEIGAVDNFIVVDQQSFEKMQLTRGSFILSYEDINPLEYYLDRKTHRRKYVFDGRYERQIRRKLGLVVSSSMDLILALQSATSNRRLAQRWEAICEQVRGGGLVYPSAHCMLLALLCEGESTLCWVTPPSLGTRVRFRAYNPAWPLAIPERKQAWS